MTCTLTERFRFRALQESGLVDCVLSIDGGTPTIYQRPYTEGLTDEITDEINISSDPKRICSLAANKRIFKNVEVIKQNLVFPIDPSGHSVYTTATFDWQVYPHKAFYGQEERAIPSKLIQVLPESGIGVSSEEMLAAARRITPSFKTYVPGVNIWNIILEFGQLKQLLELFAIKATNSVAQEASSKWLGVNFGAVPLYSDIRAIFDIITKLDDGIDMWNQFALSGQVIDFHEVIKRNSVFYENQEFILKAFAGDTRVDTKNILDGSADIDSLLHIYIKPKYIPRDKRFRAYVKAFGIDQPLTGIWESVPFSWIIDYFINIGDTIEKWETGIDSVFVYDVVSAGYSTKISSNLYCSSSHVSASSLLTVLYSGPYEVHEEQAMFVRKRLPLDFIIKFEQRIPDDIRLRANIGLKQISYLAALATLKIK